MRLIDADALIEMIDREYQDIDRQDMKMMVNKAPTISQWIPVSERLPIELQVVLVSFRTEIGTFVGKDFLNPIKGTWHYNDDVVAWMPLPEPMRLEEENG